MFIVAHVRALSLYLFRIIERVEKAYKFANTKVLNLLFDEHHLIARLRYASDHSRKSNVSSSVKHYFFMDQGDFMVHFLDSAHEELRKPAREVSLTKLQSLLDLVIRNPASSSAASTDPYKEDVKVDLSSMGLTEQLLRVINVTGALEDELMSRIEEMPAEAESRNNRVLAGSITKKALRSFALGLNAFTLDYKVPFPLSLVISKKALTRYQIIFRYIFTCKYVERQLSIAWSDHQAGNRKYTQWRKNPGDDAVDEQALGRLDAAFNQAYHLRSQMLLFVQNLIYYVFNEVLEPRWNDLEGHLSCADTVDEVLRRHADFLDTCLKECMLTNKNLLMVRGEKGCSFSNR